MSDDDLEKWKLLHAQLELDLECFLVFDLEYPDKLSTLNKVQLKDFESRAGLILPQGYQEFCQVFGSGRFGLHGFCIDCPNIKNVEEQLGSNQSILEACKDSYISSWSIEAQEWLEKAYLFGTGEGYISLIFDLRTYNEQDRSYDLYGVGCESNFIYYLGRDFFAFIRDICIGERAKEKFSKLLVGVPKDIDKNNPRYKSTTFFPVPIFEELEDA